jgi:hypothetical protein
MDFTEIKASMKTLSAEYKATIKQLEKSKNSSYKVQAEIERNRKLVQMYSPNHVLPVQIDGCVFNYKIYSAFLKKLRGHKLSANVNNSVLTLSYENGRTSGVLELLDLTSHYGAFLSCIPVVDLNEEA